MLKVLYSKNLNFKVKMGLENMIVFNQKLGNPAGQITTIHVTGTNGKGSVVHKIAKALQASGYKTGMYVSPHISSFRERITINGEMISEDDVVKYLDRINQIEPSLPTSLTFFESVTGMAFDYFKEKQVDVAVVEVGLGGRLDSTNIITPELSVITSIGLDHQGILGNTITDIAREKAGIIKDGIPVVVGPNCPHQQVDFPPATSCCLDLLHRWKPSLALRSGRRRGLPAPNLRRHQHGNRAPGAQNAQRNLPRKIQNPRGCHRVGDDEPPDLPFRGIRPSERARRVDSRGFGRVSQPAGI